MTDRYKEFKKWLINYMNNAPFTHYCGEDVEYLFRRFEKEQAEKEKEKQIKTIFSEVIFGWSINSLAKIEREKIDKIYNDLKEKDLIK